jgi:hypothetical protein
MTRNPRRFIAECDGKIHLRVNVSNEKLFITPEADEGLKYLAACREIFSSMADTPLLAAGYFISLLQIVEIIEQMAEDHLMLFSILVHVILTTYTLTELLTEGLGN